MNNDGAPAWLSVHTNFDGMYYKQYNELRKLHIERENEQLPAVFYRSALGTEPVRDWLRDLPVAYRRIVGFDIHLVEFGWPTGMPPVRSLKGGLWEVRSNQTGGQIARVIFCVADGCMVLLHGFVKKTQKTPKADLETARKRQKEIEQ